MSFKLLLKKATIAATILSLSMTAQAGIIGQWTFDDASDSTGNWSDLTLHNGAAIDGGRLDLSAGGLQWANTVWDGSGPTGNSETVKNKTLVSWVELTSLTSRTGSALTLDSATVDNFNGLIWNENYGTWQVGSSYGQNNAALGSDAVGELNEMVQVAATWEAVSSGIDINYYIDGTNVGSYTSSRVYSWSTSNMEVMFGARHTSGTTGPIVSGAGLDGYIYEARIYDTALSQAELQELSIAEVPEPSTLAIFALGVIGLVSRRLKKQS